MIHTSSYLDQGPLDQIMEKCKRGVLLVKMLSSDDPNLVDNGTLRYCILEGGCLKMWLNLDEGSLDSESCHESIDLTGNDWTVLCSRVRREQFSLVSLSPNDSRIIRLKAQATETHEWIDLLRALCDSTATAQPAISRMETAAAEPLEPLETVITPREYRKLPLGIQGLSASCMISPFAPPAQRQRQRTEGIRARCLRFNNRTQEMGIQAEAEDEPPPQTPPPQTPPPQTPLVPGNASPGIIFSIRKSCAYTGGGEQEHVWQDEEEDAASSPTASSGPSSCMSPTSHAFSPRSPFASPRAEAPEPFGGLDQDDGSTKVGAMDDTSLPFGGLDQDDGSTKVGAMDETSLGVWVAEWRRVVDISRLTRHAGGPFYAWHIETVTTKLSIMAKLRLCFTKWRQQLCTPSCSSSSSSSSSNGEGKKLVDVECRTSAMDRAFTFWMLAAAAGSPCHFVKTTAPTTGVTAAAGLACEVSDEEGNLDTNVLGNGETASSSTSRRLSLAWGLHRWAHRMGEKGRGDGVVTTAQVNSLDSPSRHHAEERIHEDGGGSCQEDGGSQIEAGLSRGDVQPEDVKREEGDDQEKKREEGEEEEEEDVKRKEGEEEEDVVREEEEEEEKREEGEEEEDVVREEEEEEVKREEGDDEELKGEEEEMRDQTVTRKQSLPLDDFAAFAYKTLRRARSSPNVSPTVDDGVFHRWDDENAVKFSQALSTCAEAELGETGTVTFKTAGERAVIPISSDQPDYSWSILENSAGHVLHQKAEDGDIPGETQAHEIPGGANTDDVPGEAQHENTQGTKSTSTVTAELHHRHVKSQPGSVTAQSASDSAMANHTCDPSGFQHEILSRNSPRDSAELSEDVGMSTQPAIAVVPLLNLDGLGAIPADTVSSNRAVAESEKDSSSCGFPDVHISPRRSDIMSSEENSSRSSSPGDQPEIDMAKSVEADKFSLPAEGVAAQSAVLETVSESAMACHRLDSFGTASSSSSVNRSFYPLKAEDDETRESSEILPSGQAVESSAEAALIFPELIHLNCLNARYSEQESTDDQERHGHVFKDVVDSIEEKENTKDDKMRVLSVQIDRKDNDFADGGDVFGGGMFGALWGPVEGILAAISPSVSEGKSDPLSNRHLQHWLEAPPIPHQKQLNGFLGTEVVSSQVTPPPRPSRRDKNIQGESILQAAKTSSNNPDQQLSLNLYSPEAVSIPISSLRETTERLRRTIDQGDEDKLRRAIQDAMLADGSPAVKAGWSGKSHEESLVRTVADALPADGSPAARLRANDECDENKLRRAIADALLADGSPAVKGGRSARLVRDVRKGMLKGGGVARKHGTRRLAMELLDWYNE